MQWQGCGNAETVIWLVVFGEVGSMYDYAFKTRRADVVIEKTYGQNEMLSNKGSKCLKYGVWLCEQGKDISTMRIAMIRKCRISYNIVQNER